MGMTKSLKLFQNDDFEVLRSQQWYFHFKGKALSLLDQRFNEVVVLKRKGHYL